MTPLQHKQQLEQTPFEKRFDESLTPIHLLAQTAAKYPTSPAVSFQLLASPHSKSSTLNWSELLHLTRQAANMFYDLAQHNNIALLLPNCPEAVVCTMSAMTSGIVCPINPLLEPEHIAALLKQTDAKILVTLKSFPKTDLAQKARAACAIADNIETIVEIDLCKHLGGLKKMLAPLLRPKVPPVKINVLDFAEQLQKYEHDKLNFSEQLNNRVCAYFHTGGTTGLPKIAQHRHRGLFYNGWLGDTMLLKNNDVVMTPLPLFHVFAAYAIWQGCLISAAHMVLPTPAGYRGDGVFDNFWQLIEKWQATFLATVPTAVAALMQRPINANISSLQFAFCGSAPLPVETFKDFQKATNVKILEGYGLTEATCLVCVNPPLGEKKIGSVGLPFPYCDVKIFQCNSDGSVARQCATDEVGEICIANPGVMVGETYTDPDKNKTLYANNNYLRSGDLGRIDSDGYIWIVGRVKDLIIRGGHNIDPALIEECLAAHPKISFVGAIGQPDAKLGETPCAYVELKQGQNATPDELLEFAKENISERAAVPEYIEIVPQLPKTAVGKIFKPELRKMAIARIFTNALENGNVPVAVADVVEDKKLGLVALLTPDNTTDDEKITSILGGYIIKWRWK